MSRSGKDKSAGDIPEEIRKRLSAKRRRKRILIAILFLLPLSVVGLWFWASAAGDRAIQAEIDRYRAAGEPIDPADFDPPPTPDDNNAALALRNAASALNVAVAGDGFDFGEHCCDPVAIARYRDEFRRIIEANSEVFTFVRQARSMTGADWGVRMRSPMIDVVLPRLKPEKDLVRFLCSAAFCHHLTGNDAEAVEILRDALGAARTIGKMPSLVFHLVSIAQDALVCSVVEDITANMKVQPPGAGTGRSKAASRKQVQALIKELLAEEELRKGTQWAFYGERAMLYDLAILLLEGKLASSVGFSPLAWDEIKIGALKPILKKDFIRMLRHMTALAEAAGQTNWPAVQEKMPKDPEIQGLWAGPWQALSSILFPSHNRVLLLDFQVRAMRRMAAVALAMRVYQLDHGRRPAKLADLVPKYLPAVPDDPFDAPGQPIRYLPKAARPILYSIGGNAKDDGGRYAETPDQSPRPDKYDIAFFLNADRPRRADRDTGGCEQGRGGRRLMPPSSQPGTTMPWRRRDPTPSTMPR